MAPPALGDYIAAHELAHLRVRGHTPEYWAVMSQAVPYYRRRRERLREMAPHPPLDGRSRFGCSPLEASLRTMSMRSS